MRIVRTLAVIGDVLGSRVPGFVRVESVKTPKFKGEWLSTPESDPERVILFFHGGAFFCGSPRSHRPISWRLAYQAKVKVLSIDYRLVPENSLEDALDDAVHAYHWLLDNGYKPENIAMGGDSAGGGLTLFTLLRLKAENLPQPAAAYCMSPCVDFTSTSESLISNSKDSIMFHVNLVKSMFRYLRRSLGPGHPLISPKDKDFSGLPPMFIHVGHNELLFGDSRLIVSKYQESGRKVILKIWNNMPHAFPLFSDFLPEGAQGLKDIAGFVRETFKL